MSKKSNTPPSDLESFLQRLEKERELCIIDEEVDHKLLLPTAYEGTSVTWEDNMHVEFMSKDGDTIKHASPAAAVCQIEVKRINRSAVVEHLTGLILSLACQFLICLG